MHPCSYQTSMHGTDPHSTHLTPPSAPFPSFPFHFRGELDPFWSRFHSRKCQGGGVSSTEEALLTRATSHAETPSWGSTTSPLFSAATLTSQSQLHLPGDCGPGLPGNFTVHVGSTIPMPFQQLDNPTSGEGVHPTQCASDNGTHIHPSTQNKTHVHSHTYPSSKSWQLYPQKHPHSQPVRSTPPTTTPGHHRLSPASHGSPSLVSLLPFLHLPICPPHGSDMTFKQTYGMRSLLCLKPNLKKKSKCITEK